MFITSLSIRRQILAGIIALTSLAAPFAATAAEMTQPGTVQPGPAEQRLHDSGGRRTDLQIARGRPSQREVAARVSDERANWSYQQWEEYARSMRGM
jgi:hypothetical protein